MKRRLLILRPQPGAGESAARAADLGLEAVVASLFEGGPLDWDAPGPAEFDAVMLTSANAARHGGAKLASFRHLPCFCVGESTGAAAAEAGFGDVRIGPGDGADLLDMIRNGGMRRVLHLGGRDRAALDHGELAVTTRAVYAAEAVAELPADALAALTEGVLVLIHSPRAGAIFAALAGAAGICREDVPVAAISDAAAAALGPGWKSLSVAPRPRDEALLELAAKLCNKGGGGGECFE